MYPDAPSLVRPWPVKTAFVLCLFSLLFALLACFFSIAEVTSTKGRDEIKEKILNAPEMQTGELPVETLTNVAVITAVGISVVFAALNIIFSLTVAFLMLKGRKLARIIITVILGINTASLLIFGASWASAGGYALFLGAVIFMWLPQSTTYFHRYQNTGMTTPLKELA